MDFSTRQPKAGFPRAKGGVAESRSTAPIGQAGWGLWEGSGWAQCLGRQKSNLRGLHVDSGAVLSHYAGCVFNPTAPLMDGAGTQTLWPNLLPLRFTVTRHPEEEQQPGVGMGGKKPTKLPGKEVLIAILQPCLKVQGTLAVCGCSGDVCPGDSRRPHPVQKT